MSQYQNFVNCDCRPMLADSSVDVSLAGCMDSEIKADVVLNTYDTLRLWGQIKSRGGYPIENALVKLVQVIHSCEGERYEGLEHTLSDCNGFYQFDLRMAAHNGCYKVLVGKCDTSAESVIGGDRQIRARSCPDRPSPCGEKPPPCACGYALFCSYDYSHKPPSKWEMSAYACQKLSPPSFHQECK